MNSQSNRRVRTRGGLRGRGRGVRTRGGGRGQSRPDTVDQFPVVDIDITPEGTQQERPLHPKRRRAWRPSPPSTSTSAAPVAAAKDQAPLESLAIPPSPAFFVECGVNPSPAISMATMSASPAVLPSPAPPSPAVLPSPAPPSLEPVPSTSQASEDARRITRREQQPRRHLSSVEIEELLPQELGSEGEESGSDDEAPFGVPVMSRWWIINEETPVDDPPIAVPSFQAPSVSEEPQLLPTEVSLSHGPTSMYEFTWSSFPDSPIPPESRRETFSPSNVGPTLPAGTPYETFMAIWDRPIIETIVGETNKYAQSLASKMIERNELTPRSRICEWYDTTVDEIYIFFAYILTMGIVCKSRLEEYWSKTSSLHATPGFSSIMSLRRFQLLNACLHFNDNEAMRDLNLDSSQAKLYKISPIIEHLNKKFQQLYVLGRNIALDESLLQWKGWLNINQLIPNKRAKIGIKSYELCESQTGYLWRFIIHANQKPITPPSADDPMTSTIPSLVLSLVQGLEHKGYTLWMDNYYNSPALARKLKTIGFDCVGTLRTNRQFVPVSLTTLTKAQMQPGQITGATSGDVDLMVWRDHNQVAVISTYHGNASCVSGGKRKPILVQDYNIMMGGVDKKDQMLAMYPIERKRTKVWYKKLFRRLLNVSVLNAYIIHKGHQACSQTKHREFRIELIDSLLEHHTVKAVNVPSHEPRNQVFDCRQHFIAEYPMNATNRRLRRHCVVCGKKVRTYCSACEKAVCIINCFVAIHSVDD